MVFFFDQTNGYVLAESTQSHHSGHASDLWLGCTVIPRGLSVCEHTVNIPEANKGSNQHFQNAGEVHIINDMRKDERFRDRPYVHERPNAQFYAGVPIKTPNGANIGAYCVLDNKPRDGLSDEDVDFLKHMGSLVMSHLDHLRTSAEYGRGARMLEGLGIISRHEEDTKAASGENLRPLQSRHAKAKAPKQPEATDSNTELLSEYAPDYTPERGPRLRSRRTLYKSKTVRSSSQKRDNDGLRPHHEAGPSADKSSFPSKTKPSTSSRSKEHEQPLFGQIRDSFQRASSLLLDAVKGDGVAFLDATTSRSPTRSFTNRRFSGMENISATDDSDNSPAYTVIRDHARQDPIVKCEVLGHSEVDESDSRPDFDSPITERFLKSLMRRYPQGKTWTFDAQGQESTHDPLDKLIDSAFGVGTARSHDESHAQHSSRDAGRLQKLFRCQGSEYIRTLCFAPMWDPVRERWYAAVLTWSKSPRHGFSRSNELSYLRAFCDVTMAEVLRIEAKYEVKAKSRLLSSVSHELRSPLHGILGSLDLLKVNEAPDWGLIEQIKKCSINLVDVIDHLLDFAQINSKAPNSKRSLDRLSKSQLPSNACSSVSLARTTEEIVDAVYYAHCFTNRDRHRSHVDLVMDLAPASSTECMISVGAWKRLCTNIVNNALKYTHEGHVKVNLDVEQRNIGEVWATFTVADTGIGMSPEFLKTRLFESFAQEDALAPGTGLGMSLVAQLIKDFHGTIEVQSEKGEGTQMTVKIPLEVDFRSLEEAFSPAKTCHGSRVHFVKSVRNTQVLVTNGRSLLIDAAENTLRSLGATICDEHGADIIAITEEDLAELQGEYDARHEQRWLILCKSFASAARLRNQCQSDHAQFIPQPYGPERLSAAVHFLRNNDRNDSVQGPQRAPLSQARSSQPHLVLPRPLPTGSDESYSTPALTSPPLDLSFEHLTLGGLAGGASATEPSLTKRHEALFRCAPKGEDAVVGSQKALVSPSEDVAEPPKLQDPGQHQPCEPPVLLLVDDNVSVGET